MKIPAFILRKLYVKGSLRRDRDGLRFTLRNTLASASLTGVRSFTIGGQEVPRDRVRLDVDGHAVDLGSLGPGQPWVFPRNADAHVVVQGVQAAAGPLKVRLDAQSAEFGDLLIEFDDDVVEG